MQYFTGCFYLYIFSAPSFIYVYYSFSNVSNLNIEVSSRTMKHFYFVMFINKMKC